MVDNMKSQSKQLGKMYFTVAAILFGAQILFGLIAGTQFVYSGFLFELLDFNVARMGKASKEEAIAEFLQHPSDNPSNERMMPNLGITADEAKGLVAFLKHMSSIDTNGFPRNFGKIEGGIHGR